MLVIPAVDLKGGKCVRLVQGDKARETVFSDDPVSMALRWQEQGAKYLHVVDLDGAFEGMPKNLDIALRIAKAVKIPVELGGGLRTEHAVRQALSGGLDRIILGTKALSSPHWLQEMCGKFPGRIVVGIDARDGMVAVEGWVAVSKTSAIEFAQQVAKMKPRAIIFTDISKDGMMAGPNVESTRGLAEAVDVPVIASGGVSSLDHVRALSQLPLEGMIIGKALYTGAIALPDAVRVADGGKDSSK